MKYKVYYKWSSLGKYTLYAAVRPAITGALRLLWAAFLLLVNIVLHALVRTARVIRHHPCTAVAIVFVSLTLVNVITYMELKTRLTTALWQRDKAELKLDSVQTMNGTKPTYYKFQKY